MDKMLNKKINLLLHLAKVDGKFDRSEKQLLMEVLKEKGLDESYIESHRQETVDMKALSERPDKTELFYWVLRMIKADNYLHPDELAYAKALAVKFKFKPDAVDFFSKGEIPNLADFELQMKNYELP